MQVRQGGVLLPPQQSVSWDNGSPSPTTNPNYPPSQPGDQISLGQPSGGVIWETTAPGTTNAPGNPDYPPPSQPTDQISLGQPSYWISWDGSGPSLPAQTPTSMPTYSEFSSVSSETPSSAVVTQTSTSSPKPTVTSKTSTTSKKSRKPWPIPTPTPRPIPPKPSDQISQGQPSYTISWGKRQQFDTVGLQLPTASLSFPDPEPPTYVSWGKRQGEDSDPPEPTDTFPTDPEDPEDPEITAPPEQQPSDQITLQPPSATIIWGKRDPVPQDSFGLGFPWQTVYYPKPNPPSFVSWGKREPVAEPTAAPDAAS